MDISSARNGPQVVRSLFPAYLHDCCFSCSKGLPGSDRRPFLAYTCRSSSGCRTGGGENQLDAALPANGFAQFRLRLILLAGLDRACLRGCGCRSGRYGSNVLVESWFNFDKRFHVVEQHYGVAHQVEVVDTLRVTSLVDPVAVVAPFFTQ